MFLCKIAKICTAFLCNILYENLQETIDIYTHWVYNMDTKGENPKNEREKKEMTRTSITVEKLIEAGYEPFEFSDYTMQQGVDDIKRGCEVRLEPRFGGYMVAVVVVKNGVNTFLKEMCSRVMTESEKERFALEMAEQEKHHKEVIKKIDARNKARMRRR